MGVLQMVPHRLHSLQSRRVIPRLGPRESLRKRREATRLADSETRYRTVADYTHDWEYWSAPDGKLLYVSPSCERITGYAPQYFMETPHVFGKSSFRKTGRLGYT